MAASRIKGITVEIGGDTTKLQDALKKVNSTIKTTQSELKDVSSLLKLDPGNTELIAQKQKYLAEQIGAVREKLETLKEAARQANDALARGEITQSQYDALQREIQATTQELSKLEGQARQASDAVASIPDRGNRLDDVNNLLNLDPGNAELLAQKQRYLGEEVDKTRKKLEELKEAAEKANAALANGDITQDEYDALQREIIETTQELKKLEDQARQSGEMVQQIAAKGEKLQSMGSTVAGVGTTMTMGLTMPLVGVATAAVKTASDFQAQMSKVEAISGATGDELASLKEKAISLGDSTKFSATEVAQGYEYMGMAGWKSGQMLAGIGPVLNLAAASGEDLGKTSDIVTDSLTALGLTAQDTGHFCDVLAEASRSSNTDVSTMGESFKYAAPLCGSMGYKVEDLATALGIMANAGIKGSSAGTTLRSMITRLANPTDSVRGAMDRLGISLDDGQGHMYSLSDVLGNMRESLKGLSFDEDAYARGFEELTAKHESGEITAKQYEKELKTLADSTLKSGDAQKAQNAAVLAGTYGLSGMIALVNASDEEFEGLSRKLENSSGSFDDIAAAVDGCGVALGGLSDGVYVIGESSSEASRRVAQDIAGMLGDVESGSASLEDVVANVAEKYGLTADDAARVVDAVSQAMSESVGTAAEMAGTMMDNLEGDTTSLTSKLSTLAISFGELILPVVRDAVNALQGLVDWLNGLDDGTKKVILGVGAFIAALGPVLTVVGNIMKVVGGVMAAAPQISAFFTSITGGATGAGGALAGLPALITGPIGIVIAIVAALAAGVVYLWNTNEDFRNKVIEIWNAVKDFLAQAWEAIKATFSGAMDAISGVLSGGWEGIRNAVTGVWDSITGYLSGAWDAIKNVVQVGVMAIGSILQAAFDIITLPYRLIWENCKDVIIEAWERIKETVSGAVDKVGAALSAAWDSIKSAATAAWNAVSGAVSAAWDKIKGTVSSAAEAVRSAVSAAWDNVRSATGTAFNAVKDVASNAWNAVKSSATSALENVRNAISNGLGAAKSTAASLLDGIKNKFKSVFEGIWSFLSSVVGKLKNVFHFSWELPKIKLPHFKITGKLSLNPPSVPHLSVEWYKKAMENGMILDGATIFGQKGGRLLGGGEAGPEAVVGVGSLMSMIQGAVSSSTRAGSMGDGPGADGGRVLSILEQYLPYLPALASMSMVLDTGATIGQLAPGMNRALGKMAKQGRRQ